ncbi:hypothetical protein FJZ17_02250 [Candidatus Pacearchaeota archaeon]|nr:hypothetical protein [Candidatus Pacearchaeota archaeon]
MKLNRFGRSLIKGIAGLALIAATGCEENSDDANNGQGRDNFEVHFTAGHINTGEIITETAQVVRGANYNVFLWCSNDGDSDRISIEADNQVIGTYFTAENRMWGNGWYVNQRAGPFSFNAQSNNVVFEVYAQTDGYGTWPKLLEVQRAD